MKNNTTFLYYKSKILRVVDKTVYPFITTILLTLLVFQVNSTLETQKNAQAKRAEVETYEARLAQFKQAAQISDHDRVLYGSILAQQIPTQESLFGSLDMVDYFNAITGLELNEGAMINLVTDKTTKKKGKKEAKVPSQLTAKGVLSLEELETFLNMYQFSFPRFLTLASIRMTKQPGGEDVYEVTSTLNIYTAPEAQVTSSIGTKMTQLTQEDIRTLEFYKEKVNQNLYVDTSQKLNLEEDSYDAATSPF